ncbi:MAG: type II secretion system protein [Kiritimatiellae bacterium]|nr:type II secretion system protein [Kiritimatiellia bacterium]
MTMNSRKGFTLVEMLVVIGILGILTGVLISSLSGSSESARNAQCLTNMKNLASACQSYGMSSEYYPLAGGIEKIKMERSGSGTSANHKSVYYEIPGWLSWNSEGKYASKPSSKTANSGWYTSAYDQTATAREYAYTNGVLFKYISGNRNTFRCPVHVRKMPHALDPAWSYVMNSYFGWHGSPTRRWYGQLKRADRRLLFAELGFMGVEREADFSTGAGEKCDCVLQYENSEVIGFNHSSGKKTKFAHVVFADGHTENIAWPKSGLGDSELKELTKWLCEGKDVSFDGSRYLDASEF